MPWTERRRFDFLRFTYENKYKSFDINSHILHSKENKKLVYFRNTLTVVSYNHEIVCIYGSKKNPSSCMNNISHSYYGYSNK